MKRVGGRALRGGVIMFSDDRVGVAIRMSETEVSVRGRSVDLRERWWIVVPVLRGILSMFEAIIAGSSVTVRDLYPVTGVSYWIRYALNPRAYLDMLRFHGAEHMTIAAHDSGLPLTVENVRGQSRLTPRCGTVTAAFVLLMYGLVALLLPVGIGEGWRVFALVGTMVMSVGVAHELARIATRVRGMMFLVWPGMILQLVTTQRPGDSHIEVAIAALNESLR